MGGLGNQMFQYAFGRALSLRYDTPLILDINSFNVERTYPYPYVLDKFKIVNANLKPEGNTRKEHWPGFDGDLLLPFDESMMFEGYFQDENYFKQCRNVLLEELTLEMNFMDRNLLAMERMIQGRVSIFIHVRRGERKEGVGKKNQGLVSMDYYLKAINMMKQWFKEPRFIFFTDDYEWTAANFNEKDSIIIGPKDFVDYHSMYLMSKCDHAIIPNSAFSWWGAWLMRNPYKIIIAPKSWTPDPSRSNVNIVPSSWIRVDPKFIT